MARLICDELYCIHRDVLTGVCGYQGDINTGDFLEYGSEETPCFGSVASLPDYKTEYWQACHINRTGTEFKRKRYGKRVEEKGIVFFTERPLPNREHWNNAELKISCTEEKTGLAFPLHRLYDEKGFAAIREIAEKRPRVMDLLGYEETEEAKEDEQNGIAPHY